MAPQGPQALFSVITSSSGNLCKTIHLDGDHIASEGQTLLTNGQIETHGVSSLAEFNEILDSLNHNQAITLGVFDPTIGAKAHIVTAPVYKTLTEKTGIIARTREHVRYFPCRQIMLYDIDDHWLDFAPLEVQASFLPDLLARELGLSHYLLRASSSSRVSRDGITKKPRSWHLYTFVENGLDIPRLLEQQFRTLVCRNLGWAVLTNSSLRTSVLIRTICDQTVGGSERLIYEAPPVVMPPLSPAPGHTSLVGTSGSQTFQESTATISFAGIEQQLKLGIESQRLQRDEQTLRARVEIDVQRLGGTDNPDLAARIRKQTTQAFFLTETVVGFHQIHTSKGTFSVADIVKTDFYARAKSEPLTFHDQTCADPIEPGYGAAPGRVSTTKAKIFTDENPIINSFAHGGRVFKLRIRSEDLLALLTRAKAEYLHRDLMRKLIYDLWRVTHFDELEKNSIRETVLDLFEEKQDKSSAREAIRLAEKNELPNITDTPEVLGELATLSPTPLDLARHHAQLNEGFLLRSGKSIFRYVNGWMEVSDTDFIPEIRDCQNTLAALHMKQEKQIKDNNFFRGTMSYLRGDLPKAEDFNFDQDLSLFQTPNSIIDFRRSVIRAKHRTDYVLLSGKHDPVAGPTPVYDRFMQNLTSGDPELLTDIESCMSTLIFPGIGKHILCLVGPTDSGKSVLANLLVNLFGEYCLSLDSDFLMKDMRTTAEERLFIGLNKKRLAFIHEIPETGYVNAGRLKKVTGGDIIAARQLYKERETIHCTASFMLVGNHHPKLQVADRAFANRLILIELQNTFVMPNGRVPDPNLNEFPAIVDIEEKLRPELPHILYKLVQLAFMFRGEPFHVPYNFKQTVSDLDTSDPLAMWARDCVQFVPQVGQNVASYALSSDIRTSIDTYMVMKNYKQRPPSDKVIFSFLTAHDILPLKPGDNITTPDSQIHTCGNPQGVLWVDGKTLRLRKNIRLINVFAGPNYGSQGAVTQSQTPGR